jgi:hypothetical protein
MKDVARTVELKIRSRSTRPGKNSSIESRLDLKATRPLCEKTDEACAFARGYYVAQTVFLTSQNEYRIMCATFLPLWSRRPKGPKAVRYYKKSLELATKLGPEIEEYQ